MSLRIPRYPEGKPDFNRISRALFEVDQFDDWLPDVVYFRDHYNGLQALVGRLGSIWDSGELATPDVEPLRLPRDSGGMVPAVALPLEARLCAHAVITNLAPRISPALPRDKVYGFRFLQRGERVFDSSGEELEHVFDLVIRAAQATTTREFRMVDVVAFNETSQPARLATVLQQCGARADEATFIREMAALGGSGLASIDDAFAFAYNFYLQPADASLVRERHNFFRYRDEYFLFNDAAETTLSDSLTELGLRGRSIGLRSAFVKRDDVGSPLIDLPNGSLTSEYDDCAYLSDECTDYGEIVFRFAVPNLKDFFSRRTAVADAVTVLPFLREFHRRRRDSMLLAPPFNGQTTEAAQYRASLDRKQLQKDLRSAVDAGSSWQAGWSSTLLSDTGALGEADVGLLLDVVNSDTMAPADKALARLALARSSDLNADRYWTSTLPSSAYLRRAALVAARHLARRNRTPWQALRDSVGIAEPLLVEHLEANLPLAE
jgi:hypothetical protein